MAIIHFVHSVSSSLHTAADCFEQWLKAHSLARGQHWQHCAVRPSCPV